VISTWQNQKLRNSGNFTPQSAYFTDDGLMCRNFTVVLTIGDETEKGSQTAFRTGIGSWTTVANTKP
jgi:surface antigen